ncbi:50S ribosome-binding GTPase [candidate division KSB1 bacterium]|nr:50S ribosome-binding GTPase [candidate division KSB1 bacterium]
MPANLTPQYIAAEERYKSAADDRERLKALKEMLAMIPKHKGTEKLQAEIKRKISKLHNDIESGKSKKGGKRFMYRVEREGGGQVAIVGPPNVGKTLLVNTLTHAHFEVGDYPYTTRIFQPAMMPFEDIQIQLIDLPPISHDFLEYWVPSIIKVADAILFVCKLSKDDVLEQIDTTCDILRFHKIEPFEKTVAETDPRWTFLPSLLAGLQFGDSTVVAENFNIINEFYGNRLQTILVNVNADESIFNLRRSIIEMLDLVRVYSKRPGHETDMDKPFVFKRNSTLMDFAREVHKDFAEHLKFAKVWGEQTYDGQRITRDYVLQDRDVIELHI